MKRFAFFALLLIFGASSLRGQQTQNKMPDKDADKKNPPAAKGAKKDQKKDEKKEEPKEEKKGGMTADTFRG